MFGLIIITAIVLLGVWLYRALQPPENTASIYDVDHMDGHAFEHFCAKLLRTDGFSNVIVTQSSNDQGVDITAVKGGELYAVQCKRYAKNLGNTPVQEVFAGKRLYGCSHAIVMTNQYFTRGAIAAADATGVILWDRDKLTALINKRNMEIIEFDKAKKRFESRTKEPLFEPDLTAWPHFAVQKIDISYYYALPHVEYVEGQKEYVKMFMQTQGNPQGNDIVELISEKLRPDEAEHFAKAMQKHNFAKTQIVDNTVHAQVHFRSIESNYDGECYLFPNWA